MVARMWNDKNFHSVLVGTQKDLATLGDSLAVPDKTKQFHHISQ